MAPTEQAQSKESRFKMLQYALDIECLEMDKCYDNFELDDLEIRRDITSAASVYMIKVRFRKTLIIIIINISRHFQIDNLRLPDNLKEISLCFIPMYKYNKIFNKESDCVYANVDRYTNGYLFFEKSQGIRSNLKYHLKFLSNRITFRTCIRAVQAVETMGLQGYFSKFDDNVVISLGEKGKVDQVNLQQIVWKNRQVGHNSEQSSAILNILNCSAYPFPFVIFGPR